MMPPRITAMAREICAKYNADFNDFVDGRRFTQCVKARVELVELLTIEGKNQSEIGRILNLHHTSITHLIKRGRPRPATVIPVPDLSGEWAI